ncbi:hypothetical protein [Anatilimnocola floriformis]|uniref:hypothetical protein n=1 Tax=Anatilimnocola floriformis TaxID=2948575 RepID=UPI0020C4E6AC|nr:hypothetical protein [Anatilimnocola floriformis]
MSKHPSQPSLAAVAPFVMAGLVAIAACVYVATRSESPPKAAQQSAPELSWEAQLAAVKNGKSDQIEITKQPIGDEELQQLAGLDSLRELLLDKGTMTSAGLAPLAKLPKLEHVRIRGARIDDEGFRALCAIPSLKRINLPQADLTNDGLSAIAQTKQLESLRFGSPRVTDDGVKHISELETIRWLHFIDLPLRDESLRTIGTHFPHLESLYIDGGKFSDAAWDEFFKAKPGLHVHVDQKHHDRDPHGHSH